MTARCDLDVVVAAAAELAESPCWHGGRLTWVDTPYGLLHSTDVATGVDAVTELGGELGAVVPTSRPGHYLAATDQGFATVERDRLTPTGQPAVGAGEFMNDGKCDRRGRFWSSVNDRTHSPGRASLHVWNEHGCDRVDDGYTLLNGIGWSPDDATMYVVDSIERVIHAFVYDIDTGGVRDRRLLCSFDERAGLPDGLAVDVDGCLWVAFYGAGCVRRIDPRGVDTARVELPVSRPTSCAFGDGTELYVTSAREGLDAVGLAAEPLAGAIWRLDASVSGAPVGCPTGAAP